MSSETKFQSELRLAGIECASSPAEKRIVQAGHFSVTQLEVGVIENVERFRTELQRCSCDH